jgi:hypothetical protein
LALDYAASWTQICNRALGRLGALEIEDLEEGTSNAAFCKTFLADAVEEVLGQFDWNCCRRRVRLAPYAEAPVFGFKYGFPTPVDLIRVVKVYSGQPEAYYSAPPSWEPEYLIENGNILSDVPEILLLYIARPDDPNMMSPGVRKAVSAALAFLLTTPITSNEQLASRIAAERAEAVERAKIEDAQMNYDPEAKGEKWYGEFRE